MKSAPLAQFVSAERKVDQTKARQTTQEVASKYYNYRF